QAALDSDNLVRVGRVGKAHGIKGEVKVRPDFGPPEDFLRYREVSLFKPGTDDRQDYNVSRCRPLAKIVVLQLDGIDDRTMAETLSGSEVWVDKKTLPDLAVGDFYWHDLVGLEVVTESGRKLGRVDAILATGGHDILVVLGGGREYLIPLRKEFLVNTDTAAGVLTVADVPGLFEIND
ncbi:MAG: 16S rRNA processing protein RimM, partial [Desulfobulbaceae bacterium]|nr:16S rRNA processing protein RimM [Desulfobulbaceae bacterium]